MERPTTEIDGCRAAHGQLADSLNAITERSARRPSLLPDWSIAHVLSHLTNNADAMTRRIEAALDGRTVDQYPGGAAGRAHAIDRGAQRSAADLVQQTRDSASRLDSLFGSVPDEGWARPVRTVAGTEHPLGLLPFRRWREVEVHHADLGLAFTPADWSPELVHRALPRLIAGLPDRSSPTGLAAWLLGRGPAPDLDPWA